MFSWSGINTMDCGVLVILVPFISSPKDTPFLSFKFSDNITGIVGEKGESGVS